MQGVYTNSPGFWIAYAFVTLLGLAIYFAPTIVAVLQRSERMVMVILLDVFLGWVVIGWVLAWVIVYQDSRRRQAVAAWPMGQASLAGLSPDGMFWWDGIAWRDTRVVAPPHAQRSPDGWWWWDGVRWRPVPPPPQQ